MEMVLEYKDSVPKSTSAETHRETVVITIRGQRQEIDWFIGVINRAISEATK